MKGVVRLSFFLFYLVVTAEIGKLYVLHNYELQKFCCCCYLQKIYDVGIINLNIYNGRIGEYKIGVHQSAAIKLLVRALWALKHLCCNDVKPKLILALGFVAFEVNASSF